jgi:hypothetical protein
MKLLIKLILFFLPSIAYCQNLIINGGFDTLTACPGGANGWPINLAVPWEKANFISSAAAVYNVCSTNSTAGVPNNGSLLDGFQYPMSGNGYAGFGVYVPNVSNRREYLRYPLNEALNSGKAYCLTFYVSLYNTSEYGIDAIGAYFSDSALTCSGWQCILNYPPQVSNPAGNFLSDTIGWMQISGCFVAQGNERFMHIGNFKTDSATQTIINPNGLWGTYYYIDNVSLYADTSLSIKETVKENSFTVFPNPANTAFSINAKKNVLEIIVSDVRGKIVLQQPFSSSIDVSELANGCYFLRCKFEDGESAYAKVSVLH